MDMEITDLPLQPLIIPPGMRMTPNIQARAGLIPGAKKYRGAKNALESFDDPPVMAAIFGKVKELEEFCGRLEPYHTALLADRQRRNPNWNEPVLAVVQTVIWM